MFRVFQNIVFGVRFQVSDETHQSLFPNTSKLFRVCLRTPCSHNDFKHRVSGICSRISTVCPQTWLLLSLSSNATVSRVCLQPYQAWLALLCPMLLHLHNTLVSVQGTVSPSHGVQHRCNTLKAFPSKDYHRSWFRVREFNSTHTKREALPLQTIPEVLFVCYCCCFHDKMTLGPTSREKF